MTSTGPSWCNGIRAILPLIALSSYWGPLHTQRIYDVAFSPDGKFIASSSGDQTIRLWHIESGADGVSLVGHTDHVTSIVFTPNGRRLLSASRDKTIKVWELERGLEVLTLRDHSRSVNDIELSEDGSQLVSVSDDDSLKLWNARPLGIP